ncbi:MAG: hypothetical protein ABI810_12360 [Sphingomonas bacterium]
MFIRLVALVRSLTGALFQPGRLSGTWYLLASGKVVFRVVVRKIDKGWSGAWHHPDNFRFDGISFTNVSGEWVKEVAQAGRSIDCGIELIFEDPASEDPPFTMVIHGVDPDTAKMTFTGTNLQGLPLVRSPGREPPWPWDPGRSYDIVVAHSTSTEMDAIFAADQSDRAALQERLGTAGLADLQRREQTRQLLESGQLNSGSDFYHAAFVFQHGDCSIDYLQSHLLALVAVARGRNDALWIAAASLDRYLLSIGQPQVLGTQVSAENGAIAEPFDRKVVPNTLHDALRLPPRVE